MEVPYGVVYAANKICKLNKAIYGFKQGASIWYKTIRAVFIKKLQLWCRPMHLREERGRQLRIRVSVHRRHDNCSQEYSRNQQSLDRFEKCARVEGARRGQIHPWYRD